jgi:glycolate oxidase iron-sulfur subunit
MTHSIQDGSLAAFDEHHPPARAVLDTCVHCGFCLATCPTYVLWGQEMDSPRGRIYLMDLATEGAMAMTPEWVSHFDTCLGCMACMPACPSGVDYGQLIEATRAQIARRYPRSAAERGYRQLLFATLPRPDRLRLLRWPMALYQRTGLQALLRRTGLLSKLPASLRAMEALMPAIAKPERTPRLTPAAGAKRRRVGLLLGCVQREFLSPVNAATARVPSSANSSVTSRHFAENACARSA